MYKAFYNGLKKMKEDCGEKLVFDINYRKAIRNALYDEKNERARERFQKELYKINGRISFTREVRELCSRALKKQYTSEVPAPEASVSEVPVLEELAA
jgi:HEPN domain-containing protein